MNYDELNLVVYSMADTGTSGDASVRENITSNSTAPRPGSKH